MKYNRHCLFTPYHSLSSLPFVLFQRCSVPLRGALPITPLLLFFIFLFSFFNFTTAQSSNFIVHRQQRIILPNHVENISFLDSNLYFYVSSPVEGEPGVLMQAQRQPNTPFSAFNFQLKADTTLVKLNENINYVVRHPSTGDLYFTALDSKGRSYLYYCHEETDGKKKVSQIKMDGSLFSKGMNVFHPTFTDDGEVMVFSSSREDRNKGSLDLWYSRFNGEEWSDPTNLGHRINTSGDEVNPFIYHDCLLYASNGNVEYNNNETSNNTDHTHFAFYATRLISDASQSDATRGRQIGRCLVQRLPFPFNVSGTDNLVLSVDPISNTVYLISNRDDIFGRQLYSSPGPLEGMLLWGTVSDKFDHPLSGVAINAIQNDSILCSTTSDENGRYSLYLQCGQHYELTYRLPNYFVNIESLSTTSGETGYLITENHHNIKLDGLPIGQRIYFDDLFGPDADVDLSPRGKEELKPLVQFLIDNPTKRVTLSLINDLTNDATFNSLLTDHRIQQLEKHLNDVLPATIKFTISNGCYSTERCSSGTGSSILTVLIDN